MLGGLRLGRGARQMRRDSPRASSSPAAGRSYHERLLVLEAARSELHVVGEDNSPAEPVKVSKEEFQRAMRMLAPDIGVSEQPMEVARLLMDGVYY